MFSLEGASSTENRWTPENSMKFAPYSCPMDRMARDFICKDNFAILYRGFRTTTESAEKSSHTLCDLEVS